MLVNFRTDHEEPKLIYRITKAQAEKFGSAIRNLGAAPQDKRVHPKLQKAELDALRSQLSDLQKDLEEYEALSFMF